MTKLSRRDCLRLSAAISAASVLSVSGLVGLSTRAQPPSGTPGPTPSATPTIPSPPIAGLTIKTADATGYIYAVDSQGNTIMQALYYPNTGTWEWVKLLTKDEMAAAVKPYAQAMGIDPSVIKPGQLVNNSKLGDPFLTLVTQDGTHLMFTSKGEKDGKSAWNVARPGSYWHAKGKFIGLYMNGDELRSNQNRDLTVQAMGGGRLVGSQRTGKAWS
jgi:hypothetical protein